VTSFHADFTALREIEDAAAKAARDATTVSTIVLASVANRVFVDAVANAQATALTGELARSVQIERTNRGSADAYMIGAPVRQAFFLEYGSPNTGAPRPWLSAPALKGQDELASHLDKVRLW